MPWGGEYGRLGQQVYSCPLQMSGSTTAGPTESPAFVREVPLHYRGCLEFETMPLKTHVDEQPTLNLTPMIDIVFLLIIFFMVGTKFSELERKIGLRIPDVSNVEALTAAPEPKVVNIYSDGQITLDRTPVDSLAELTERLAAARSQYSDLGVLVRGDASGRFQNVAEVLNACKQADVRELGIAVRPTAPQR